MWVSSQDLAFKGMNMVPLCILLCLWGGYMQERRMDLGMNVHETSYNTGWSWCEKRNHRPGFGNPYAVHSYMKVQEYVEFLYGPVVGPLHFPCRGQQTRSTWSSNKIPQAIQCGQGKKKNKKQKTKLRNIRFKTNLPGHYESLFVCCCCCC